MAETLNSFTAYIREVEAELTPEQREQLDEFRDHYAAVNRSLTDEQPG